MLIHLSLYKWNYILQNFHHHNFHFSKADNLHKQDYKLLEMRSSLQNNQTLSLDLSKLKNNLQVLHRHKFHFLKEIHPHISYRVELLNVEYMSFCIMYSSCFQIINQGNQLSRFNSLHHNICTNTPQKGPKIRFLHKLQ